MTLRLIEMMLNKKDGSEVANLLENQKIIEMREVPVADEEVLVKILLNAEESETTLDLLEERYKDIEGFRLVVLPVEATMPRVQPDTTNVNGKVSEEKMPERIGREELYEDIKDATRCSKVYLLMVVLSTIVASIGLRQNNMAMIIGSMVIAPLLGPNIALALATTLGDLSLLWRGSLTNLAGISAAIVMSIIIGFFMHVDPTVAEIAARTRMGFSDIIVALVSGCAGAIAFTTGISATLVGVMVAVSLLPPLVTSGLLLGGGHQQLAIGAFLLFVLNLICINLSGVITFVLQGIYPTNWWEKERAWKATLTSITLLIILLSSLISLVILARKGMV